MGSSEEASMKKSTQARPAIYLSARNLAVLGLLILGLLFAPLGQGLGLSAGQGLDQAAGPSAVANALASREVEKLASLK